jgi:hypothetical protein
MNKRELKKVLKRHLAGYLLDNQALEEWARLNYQVNKTEAKTIRWDKVKMELFDELFGDG